MLKFVSLIALYFSSILIFNVGCIDPSPHSTSWGMLGGDSDFHVFVGSESGVVITSSEFRFEVKHDMLYVNHRDEVQIKLTPEVGIWYWTPDSGLLLVKSISRDELNRIRMAVRHDSKGGLVTAVFDAAGLDSKLLRQMGTNQR